MATIQKRKNSYRIVVSAGYDNAGRQIRKSTTYKPPESLTARQLEKELNRIALEFELQCQKNLFMDSNITFSEFCEKWFSDYAEKQLAPKTIYEYKRIYEHRLKPALGYLKINKIQVPHILSFYDNLSESGIRLDDKYKLNQKYIEKVKANRKKLDCVADSTISGLLRGGITTQKVADKISGWFNLPRDKMFIPNAKSDKLSGRSLNHVHKLLNTIFNAGVQWQILDDNPCRRIKAPKAEKKEAKHYDENQVAEMFNLLDNEEICIKLAVYMGIFVGLRLGELSALSWDDIDFQAKTLTINKSRQYIAGRGTIEKETKTSSSNRVVSLSDMLITLLEEYQSWQTKRRYQMGDKWQYSGKIFTSENGGGIFPTTPSKWFSEFLQRRNLEKITFHQLRHTNASLLISQGVDIVTVSKRLGHAKTSTTTDIYAHIIKKTDTAAAEKLNTLFSPTNDKKSKSRA